jgi:hypothetical protein
MCPHCLILARFSGRRQQRSTIHRESAGYRRYGQGFACLNNGDLTSQLWHENFDEGCTRAVQTLRILRRRRQMLCFTPQVLAEFWSVHTRPA